VAVRILVIDDDADDVELVDRLLMEQGYIPLLAKNGEDAIRIAEIQQPDLVLLDLYLPKMNGFEIANAIRMQPGLERTRIVAVTGATDDAERVAAAGFDGYITKPLDPDTFVQQIQHLLARRLPEAS
jgi:CheY-like chemotaxis protein